MTVLVTFYSISGALQARMLRAERGADGIVVPVPRTVSASCGYALETAAAAPDALAAALNGAGIEWDAVYRPATGGGGNGYELIVKRGDGEECLPAEL